MGGNSDGSKAVGHVKTGGIKAREGKRSGLLYLSTLTHEIRIQEVGWRLPMPLACMNGDTYSLSFHEE